MASRWAASPGELAADCMGTQTTGGWSELAFHSGLSHSLAPLRSRGRNEARGQRFLVTAPHLLGGDRLMLARDEHVDRGDDEQSEARADDHPRNEHDPDAVARSGTRAPRVDEGEVA